MAPAQFSKQKPQMVGWTQGTPGWSEPPTNKILQGKLTPRTDFCLLAPAQFIKQIPFFVGLQAQGWGEPLQIKFYQ
jgi:hypothetical protein